MADKNVNIIYSLKDKASSSIAKLQSKFKSLGETVFSLAGAAGIAGLVASMSKLIGLSETQRKVLAQTEQVIKSTGGAAGLTSKEVNEMAKGLQKVTNFGDEAIQAGQNLLLTFTKIGKDVFPDATEIMLDMSTAMGQDLKSSAIQVGKALNDPILGLTALSRVGIQFTEEQKEQIKVLQQSGDMMGAQKIILSELKTEFGGSAKALVDPFTQLKNSLGDLGEIIGQKISPALGAMATYIGNLTDKIVDFFGNIDKENKKSSNKILNSKKKDLKELESFIANQEKTRTNRRVAETKLQIKNYENELLSLKDTEVEKTKEIINQINNKEKELRKSQEYLEKLQKKDSVIFLDAKKEKSRLLKKEIDEIEKAEEKKAKESKNTSNKIVKNTKEQLEEEKLLQTKKEEESRRLLVESLKEKARLEKEEAEKVLSLKKEALADEKKLNEERVKDHEDTLKDIRNQGQNFGEDYERALDKFVEDVVQGENGAAKKAEKGLVDMLGESAAAFAGGLLGGIVVSGITGILTSILGSKPVKTVAQYATEMYDKMVNAMNRKLQDLGKERTTLDKQLSVLSELKEQKGINSLITDESILKSLGFDKQLTVLEAIQRINEKMLNVNDKELDVRKSELETAKGRQSDVIKEIQELKKRSQSFNAFDIPNMSSNERMEMAAVNTALKKAKAENIALSKLINDITNDLAATSNVSLDELLDNLSILGQLADLQSNVPGFANGGIVGGSSLKGDKIFARLNSQEMILNDRQINNAGAIIEKADNAGNKLPQNVLNKNIENSLNRIDQSINRLAAQKEVILMKDATMLAKMMYKSQDQLIRTGQLQERRQ